MKCNFRSTKASKKTTIEHNGLQDSEAAVEVSRLERTVITKWGVEKKRAEKICARVRLVVRSEWCVYLCAEGGRQGKETLYPVIPYSAYSASRAKKESER